MKLLVLASDQIVCDLLETLYSSAEISFLALLTQEDKKQGRKQLLKATDTALWAKNKNIEIFKTSNFQSQHTLNFLTKINPDICLVFAFGQIIPEEILKDYLFINIHASLLPAYRGASPIETALLNNDRETGISYIRMTKRLDAGPIFTKYKIPIKEQDDYISLRKKLSLLAAETVLSTLKRIINLSLKEKIQKEEDASFCQKIKKEEGRILWHRENSSKIMAKIRAFAYWPKAYFFIKIEKKKKRVIVLKARKNMVPLSSVYESQRLMIRCADGQYIEILSLILEGKAPMSAKQFLNGYKKLILIE